MQPLSEALQEGPEFGLEDRVAETLRIFSEWGYAATVGSLSEHLLGGAVDPTFLLTKLEGMDGVELHGEVVCLEDRRDLVAGTARRTKNHAALEPAYLGIARSFSQDLVRWCPFVQCVAVAGSLSSGGFDERDDIDFDLFVEEGTKYTCYLMAVLLGIRYAWTYRKREVDEVHRTPLVPKITCVNVVWPETETRPFVRTDKNLAFELLRCRPLFGVIRFRAVLEENLWIRDYFPQLYEKSWTEEIRRTPSPLSRFLFWLGRWGALLRLVEAGSKGISWALYRYVQWSRRRNPKAKERMEFLRRVKYPYEVFQD